MRGARRCLLSCAKVRSDAEARRLRDRRPAGPARRLPGEHRNEGVHAPCAQCGALGDACSRARKSDLTQRHGGYEIDGRRVRLGAFPVSIETKAYMRLARNAGRSAMLALVRESQI